MKYLSIFLSLVVSMSSLANEVQLVILDLTGDVPSQEQLSALIDSGSISNFRTLVAPVDQDGAFNHEEIETVTYPIQFSDSGKPTETANREIGVKVFGTIEESDDISKISFTYSNESPTATIIHSTASGNTVAQPVFRTDRYSSSVTSRNLEAWSFTSLHKLESEETYRVYGIRVVDTAQQGAAANP